MGCFRCGCDNDVDDFSVQELLDEINSRLKGQGKVGLIPLDDVEAIRRAIRSGNLTEATWLFDTAVLPKWKDEEACRMAWAISKPQPTPRVGLWFHA